MRLLKKILFIVFILTSAFFTSKVINWYKLSPDKAKITEYYDLYLKDVDSSFVVGYGIEYNHKYRYYITGDIKENVYRSEDFLKSKVIYDTSNLLLNKEILKKM